MASIPELAIQVIHQIGASVKTLIFKIAVMTPQSLQKQNTNPIQPW